MDEQSLAATVGCLAVLVLMFMRVPIAVCLGSVAFAGFGYLNGWTPALGILIDSPIRTVTNFNFSVIPLFVLMGALVGTSGMSRELFRAANAWIGHLPGGMAMATIVACGGFAAINGSSVATAATMTQVALPEMRRAGYDPGLSAGVIASGGTLGIMIPPSVMFILYSIITEESLEKLFISGILPGLLAITLYCTTVQVLYRIKRDWMPETRRATWPERWESLRGVWATALLFFAVIGSIYGGIVTVSEAAALGVLGALLIGIARRRLTWPSIVEALIDSLRTSSAIFFILIGAFLFQYFLAVTQAPQHLGSALSELKVAPIEVVILIMIFYIIAGMFVDGLAVVLLTIPIFHPVIVDLGFDPIWFGVLLVTTVEIGLISPPVGMICFVMNNMTGDIGLARIFKGVMPFICSDIVRLTLLVAFPSIALFLVRTMT